MLRRRIAFLVLFQEQQMNVKKHWIAYCSGNTLDATEDDWNNFIMKIFLNWRKQQLDLDPKVPREGGTVLAEYADTHYNFTQFSKSTDTYQELVDLESKRRHP
jgi:hypothetical protein